MNREIPKVLVIGSCRVFRPLRRMHEAKFINVVNVDDRYWFTHTAAAARQFVEVMAGETQLPQELRSLAMETELEWPDDLAMGLPESDVTVVEISSLKNHDLHGIKLNAHKVYGVANATTDNYRPVVQGHTDHLPESHILKRMTVSTSSYSDLVADLEAIQQATKSTLMVVDHLYSETPTGEPVPERTELTKVLEQAAAELSLLFHSTRDLILRHGQYSTLQDHNHYRADFEHTVGLEFYRSIQRLAG